ncbi:transposase [Metabacillus arenae]|uniref:Transposase n=1 Tax=Metabacillus arenae TaxID=2771434 RepID=A0A926NFE2_9BACI|nr:transposase [Metabacillus arenae]MBD1382469.1 transposase [Metabacillus arenae]
MAKTTSPSFVLSLELAENPLMLCLASDELEICRVMYNTVLGTYLKREAQMKREKHYKKLIRHYKGVSKKLKSDKENKFLQDEKKKIQLELKKRRENVQLTEYASHEWVKPIRSHFGNKVNSAVAQKIASRAWSAFQKKVFGQSKKVRFIRKGEMDSFEGKTNTTGWRYVDRHIVYKELSTPLLIKEKDTYVSEVVQNIEKKMSFSYKVHTNGETKTLTDLYRVKYVRIVKKEIRGRIRYFANLVIAGYPPSKKRKLGKGKVGLDIGTSTLAVVSLTKVALVNLAEQVKQISNEILRIQRKMDRSKRATNPNHYHSDGTIKKGHQPWIFSNRYQKLRSQLKEMHRKQAAIRKLSHRSLANHLLMLGNTFYTETMNYKALQKRKKETEVSERTGQYKRKKRFGKTLGHRAPAMFLSILEKKVKQYGGTFIKINTQTFKASQYCHIRNDYMKKPLSERWHIIDNTTKIQRDLYSAFLLMNSNSEGTKANQKRCHETFPLFKNLHDQEIQQILKQKKGILNSGIIIH